MIKKVLFGLACTAIMASCNDDYTDWANPLQNAEEEATEVTLSLAPADLIDYNYVTTDSVQLFVPTVTSTNTTTTTYTVELSAEGVDDTQTITANAEGYVDAEELKTAVAELFGRRPEQRDITLTVTSYTQDGEMVVKNTGTTTASALLVAPEISSTYYIIGGALDWNSTAARTQQFEHSDADVYDDPEFTITISAADGDTWFAIADDQALDAIDNDSDWSQLFGCTNGGGDATGTSGSLNRRSSLGGDNSFMVASGSGSYIQVTINMMDYTYTITPLNFGAYYYLTGGDNDWSHDTQRILYGANYDGKYKGWYYLSQEFKFKPNADNWDDDLDYVSDGVLTVDGSSNIPAPTAGVYQIDLDAKAYTYSLTPISTITIIGDFNSWSDDGEVELTYDTTTATWKGTATGLSGGYKFRANKSWDINWGGDATNLTLDGANLQAESGDYDFELSLSYEGNCSVTITQK